MQGKKIYSRKAELYNLGRKTYANLMLANLGIVINLTRAKCNLSH